MCCEENESGAAWRQESHACTGTFMDRHRQDIAHWGRRRVRSSFRNFTTLTTHNRASRQRARAPTGSRK